MNGLCKMMMRLLAFHSSLIVLYILSYAPFLRCSAPNDPVSGSFYYRSPFFYRPVEWLTLKTGPTSPLLKWATLFGSSEAAQIQTWFFAQGCEDPSDFDVHWMSPQ